MSDSEKLELLDLKLEKNPKDARALSERAELLLALHRTDEAAIDIDKAVEYSPNKLEYRLLQADIYFAKGNIEKSYNALTEAERLEPENKDVQLKMGEIMFYSRDYDRALTNLSKVTAAEPDNRTALFMKGFIYKEKGDTANAVGLLQKVCDLYPDYEPAFEELGIIYANRLNPLALEYLGTALRLEPTNTNVLYALAMFNQERKEMEEAEKYYRLLLDVNEKSADAWHNLGYIELFFYRDYERAIEYMTKAIECDAGYTAAWVNRGCAYELNNQPDKARQDFIQALSIDAQYEPALEGMKRIK